MAPDTIKQAYRNRAEAFDQFVSAGQLPVKRAKFYEDCKRLKMVQLDKTILLADLMAYAKTELRIDPVSGQSLADKSRASEKEDLEIRKLRADVEAKESANRKEDDRWMEVVEHERQMAAFAGLMEESLLTIAAIKLSELVYLCGGDQRRAGEFNQGLRDLIASAMSEAVKEQTRTITFDGDDDA